MSFLTEDRDSSLYVYKPFIRIFRLVGCMPGTSGKPTPRSENWFFCEDVVSWHSVAYAIQHFIMVHFAFRCFFHLGNEDFWPIAVELLRSFASITTVHILTRYNGTFHQVLKDMDLVKGSAVENLKMANTARRSLRFCVFYIMIRCVLDMMRVVAPKVVPGHYVNFTSKFNDSEVYTRFIPVPTRLEEYAKINWYGADLTQVDSATKGFLAVYGAFEVVLFRFLVSGSFAFSLTLFCTMCHHLNIKYAYFNQIINDLLNDKESIVTSEMMMGYRRTLALMAQAVSTVDKLFSKNTFLWFAMFLSGFCADITAMFAEYSNTKEVVHVHVEEDPLMELNLTLDGGFLLFWWIAVSVWSSKVYEAATESVRPFQHISSRKNWEDVDFALQSRLLFTQLHDIKVGITAWNFFIINRAAILTIGGALITYLIVVIQMNPIAVRMLLKATTSQGNGPLDELD